MNAPYTAGPPVTDADYAYQLGRAQEQLVQARQALSCLGRQPLSREYHNHIDRQIRSINGYLGEICNHWTHDLSPAGMESLRPVMHCRTCDQRLVRDDDGKLISAESFRTEHARV